VSVSTEGWKCYPMYECMELEKVLQRGN
jgi:hypothetical protein